MTAAKQKSPSAQKATLYPTLRDEYAVSTQSIHQRPATKQTLVSLLRCDELIASHDAHEASTRLGKANKMRVKISIEHSNRDFVYGTMWKLSRHARKQQGHARELRPFSCFVRLCGSRVCLGGVGDRIAQQKFLEL